MPIETLDRTPPPFFRQGPSALSRFVFCSALALFLMVVDARFHMAQPLRAGISAVLYSAQWLVLQPVQWGRAVGTYVVNLDTAQRNQAAERAKLLVQSQRAGQVETLLAENQHLRALLGLRARIDSTQSIAAQALYDATDPFSRRVVIDKGMVQGIQPGSPVIDESGVLGQVTRVYPFVSEITLLVDRDQAIPVFSPRTGLRSIAYGDPSTRGGVLELRYVSATEDVKPGDLLTTSGIDGVYPSGLPVARIISVERQGDSSFARILCQPVARVSGVTQVMVLAPIEVPPGTDTTAAQLPPLAGTSGAAFAMPAASGAGAQASAPRRAASRDTGAASNARALRERDRPASAARAASPARAASASLHAASAASSNGAARVRARPSASANTHASASDDANATPQEDSP